jgi:AhpD family alkylhydroperoxidase
MAGHADTLTDLKQPTRSLRKAIPATWAGFTTLHDAAMAEGEVPTRLKEAAALAISVVKRCDGCIAYHAKAAARAGATPAEVAELLGVALLMDGGTASVYAPRAWEAFHEFWATASGGPSWRDEAPAVVEVDRTLHDSRGLAR